MYLRLPQYLSDSLTSLERNYSSIQKVNNRTLRNSEVVLFYKASTFPRLALNRFVPPPHPLHSPPSHTHTYILHRPPVFIPSTCPLLPHTETEKCPPWKGNYRGLTSRPTCVQNFSITSPAPYKKASFLSKSRIQVSKSVPHLSSTCFW